MKQKICILGTRSSFLKTVNLSGIEYICFGPAKKLGFEMHGEFIQYDLDFPQSEQEVSVFCEKFKEELKGVTLVIASGEGTVVSANLVREALGLSAYPKKVIQACSNKLFMKRLLSEASIPMTKFLGSDEVSQMSMVYKNLGEKIVAKELNNSGGKGQTVLTALMDWKIKADILFEGFIFGKEMSVESFVQNGKIKFQSTTQYFEKGAINIVPAHYDSELISKVLGLNKRVLDTIGIDNGLTHLEVYLTDSGVLFGEIALRPPGGYIMDLIELSFGVDPWQMYLDIHLGSDLNVNSVKRDYSAAMILHPGQGTCKKIEGEEYLESVHSLRHKRIKGKIGQKFSAREGVSQEKAHFILQASGYEDLEKDIIGIRDNFKFILE